MIYIIAEPCVGTCDTACVDVCPVDCIHGPIAYEEVRETRKAGGQEAVLEKYGKDITLFIDPEECISCGACEPECPVDAIFEDEEVPEKWEKYIDLNAEFFQNR